MVFAHYTYQYFERPIMGVAAKWSEKTKQNELYSQILPLQLNMPIILCSDASTRFILLSCKSIQKQHPSLVDNKNLHKLMFGSLAPHGKYVMLVCFEWSVS